MSTPCRRLVFGRRCSSVWGCLALVLLGALLGEVQARGQALRLRIHPTIGLQDTTLNESLPGKRGMCPTRLDFLLSGLALRRKDGTWLESQDWYAYVSASGRMTAEGTGTPAGEYTGLRFRIGVDEAMNQADPHQHPPGHALNPQTNGLHWGLMGGYIFLALEGRWQNGDKDDGFSFHLANAPQLMTVEVPVEFQGGRPLTVDLDLDLARVFQGIDLAKDGTSTHSREGDPLAAKLKDNIGQAFRARRVSYDVFQTLATAENAAPLPAGTHAFTPAITQRFPQVKLPPDNPLTQEGVALGRQLFHDVRLSINGTQSCASCHDQAHAFADPRQFSVGAEGSVGKRNAMPLFNLAWHQGFFWDGRAPTLRQQVLMPVQDAHEMNEKPEHVCEKLRADADCAKSFAQAFGSPGVTPERMAMALEQFLLTLVSQNSRYDRAARKMTDLTESEKRGLQLFVTEFDPKRGLRGADCFHCHGGTLFASQPFGNNGLALTTEDLGQMAVTKNAADRGKFKVPSLRNIALTAPYMHDGRFNTLEEVVEHYSSGVQRTPTLDPNLAKHPEGGLQLTAQEKADLVAFLRTLTDEHFAETSRPATASAR
ncbi:MAG: MbnP family protein [Prosthecobacter sp.]